MIDRSEFDRYDRQLEALSRGAADRVESMIAAFRSTHPHPSIAEIRDFAIEMMSGAIDVYGTAAASSSADFFDSAVGGRSARVDYRADRFQIDATARYQARLLEMGDFSGFERGCSSYAADAIGRAADLSMIDNAGRDSDVRFARVPAGGETCTFCAMLASRGFVYRSAKTAGEAKHFHRGCRCRIVACRDGDTLEGYDPDRYAELWRRYEELDRSDIPSGQRDAVKAALFESLRPQGDFARLDPVDFARALDRGLRSAWMEFARSKTPADYERTVGRLLRMIGDASGSSFASEHMAKMSGEELWAAIHLAKDIGALRFRHSDRSLSPDLDSGDGVVEIKTPWSIRKISNRLSHAAEQLSAVDATERRVCLSLLHLAGSEGEAVTVAQRFVDDGTFESVLVLLPDGRRVELRKKANPGLGA